MSRCYRGSDLAKELLYAYRQEKAELLRRRRDALLSTPLFAQERVSGGELSRPTESRALKLASDPELLSLARRVGAVEDLLRWVDQQPDGAQVRGLLEEVYFRDGFRTLPQAGASCGLSPRQAARRHGKCLAQLRGKLEISSNSE